MNDLISRQAAIDALDALCDMECEYSKKQRSVMCGACHLGSAFDVIEQLPSAQPDVPDTNVGDMISRQAAIELFKDDIAAVNELNNLPSLPSAQPGWIPCSECEKRCEKWEHSKI